MMSAYEDKDPLTPIDDMTYNQFVQEYNEYCEWRDWYSLDLLCDEYPEYYERIMEEVR